MADIPVERQAIGERIRNARKESGLSSESIATHFGRTVKTYYHWETGVSMPTADQLSDLCRLLEVSADHLLTGVSAWPYDLFQPDDYALLSKEEKTKIEDSIAGAILRRKRKQRLEAA